MNARERILRTFQGKKVVYPKKEKEAIPNSRIGPNARAICGYLRYMGLPFRKVAKVPFCSSFHLDA